MKIITANLDNISTTRENLTGRVFDRLTVIEFVSWNYKIKQSKYKCICSCGNEVVVFGGALKTGNTKSCGCLQKERASEANIKHGGRGTRLYTIWKAMKQRCIDPNTINYKHYGGKGITVYKEWIHNFDSFREWALENNYNDKMSIDRIDTNKNYEPDNCQWLTRSENTAKGNRQRSRTKKEK
jgi:hypothetical protein